MVLRNRNFNLDFFSIQYRKYYSHLDRIHFKSYILLGNKEIHETAGKNDQIVYNSTNEWNKSTKTIL